MSSRLYEAQEQTTKQTGAGASELRRPMPPTRPALYDIHSRYFLGYVHLRWKRAPAALSNYFRACIPRAPLAKGELHPPCRLTFLSHLRNPFSLLWWSLSCSISVCRLLRAITNTLPSYKRAPQHPPKRAAVSIDPRQLNSKRLHQGFSVSSKLSAASPPRSLLLMILPITPKLQPRQSGKHHPHPYLGGGATGFCCHAAERTHYKCD